MRMLHRWIPVFVLLLALLFSMVLPTPFSAILPWLALVGVIIYLSQRAAARRALVQQAMTLHELVTLRHYVQAIRRAWTLLPKLVHALPLHGQAVATMAHCLDQLRLDEQSLVCYDYMLAQLPPNHPAAMQLSISRAITALNCDRLSDADDALQRVRPAMQEAPHGGFTALYEMARLVQSMATYHHQDVIDQADRMLEALRPLGLDAGYGHGLIALAYMKQAQRPPRKGEDALPSPDMLWQQARQWWSQATLLIPAETLVFRFPAMAELHEALQNDKPDPVSS